MHFHEAVARVFELSIGELLRSRRTLLTALIAGSGVCLAIAVRVIAANGTVYMNVNGADVGGADVFGMIMGVLFLRLAVPVLGVWYGTSLIADEVDEKTITYLFVRPARRGAVLFGKYLAYLACTGLVVLPAVVAVYFALMASLTDGLQMLRAVGVLSLGLAAYGAVFALVGVLLRRPLVIGLVLALGWEPLAMVLPGYLQRVTLVYHLEAVLRDGPGAIGSLLCLLVVTAGCLTLAARIVEHREFVLEQ